ncbi:hypothetical protein GGD52_003992 [Agrobacterium tumefaciens]|nr:hypothetical protein [Agrobacterium radiobacter]MBB5589369.1 hypothetical protein [Agrobacterium radiobacter]
MAYDDGGTLFHDSRLFRRDQLNAVTEISLVIERNRHNDRDSGVVDHIGRIETPTKTHFDDSCVSRMFRKKKEHNCSQNLEDGNLLAFVGNFNTAQSIREDSIIDKAPPLTGHTDAIAFMPIDEMWLGMHVHGKSGCFQQGPTKGADRAFAVGAGDMDDGRHSILRIAEFLKEPGNSIERKIEPLGVELHQLFDDLLGLTDRGLRHVFRSPFRRFACHLSAAPKMKSCNV